MYLKELDLGAISDACVLGQSGEADRCRWCIARSRPKGASFRDGDWSRWLATRRLCEAGLPVYIGRQKWCNWVCIY
jgi:hypothetical protein